MATISPTTANLYMSDPYAASTTDGVLGKEAFMNLLVTQLRNQDPLEPMENTEFVAQLAQFSSLEQLWNMNGNLQTNVILTQSLQNSLLSGLIDHQIRVAGNNVILHQNEDAILCYELDTTASVSIEIMDESGAVVRTLQVGQGQAGENFTLWDGKDDAGEALAPGAYSYRVVAIDANGVELQVSHYTIGTVTGIRFVAGNPTLLLGSFEISPSEVMEIGSFPR